MVGQLTGFAPLIGSIKYLDRLSHRLVGRKVQGLSPTGQASLRPTRRWDTTTLPQSVNDSFHEIWDALVS